MQTCLERASKEADLPGAENGGKFADRRPSRALLGGLVRYADNERGENSSVIGRQRVGSTVAGSGGVECEKAHGPQRACP